MAYSLNVLQPVYQDNLILSISGSTGNTCYYQVKLYIANTLVDTFNYPAKPTSPYSADINMSTLLAPYFTSSVYTPTGTTSSHPIFEVVPNSIVLYRVDINVYTSGNTYLFSGTTGGKYVFNGAVNIEDNFDIKNFIMSGTSSGYFLTNFHADREINLLDKMYLSVISGNYGTLISNFDGVTITRHQFDGSSSGITFNPSPITAVAIINIDVSPKRINQFYSNFINSNTEYYTVVERDNYSKETITVKIVQEFKNNESYNFIYLNRLGGIDCFSFTLVSNDNYNISKNVLDQYINQKVYYTDIARIKSVMSQYLSVDQGKGLQELFMSAAVQLYHDSLLSNIKIINPNVPIRGRYPKDQLIQYVAQFMYLNRFNIQQY